MTYKVFNNNFGKIIVFNETEWIPEDEGNKDYKKYLEWLAAGNEPEVMENP